MFTPALPQAALYASLGALIALTAYAHWIGLLLAPLFGVFISYLLATRQPISRRVISYSLFGALIALIVAIPYHRRHCAHLSAQQLEHALVKSP
jgi:hypothetical protein